MQFPLDYAQIRQAQFKDEQLQLLRQQKPLEYPIMEMGNKVQLICQVRPGKPWQIAVPT
jgi:hypothetical protein